jgi:transcriptional regulator with XRE-family HTH domain
VLQENFEQIFKKHLTAKRYTEAMLAELLGVTPGAVNRWVKGQVRIPYERAQTIFNIWKLNKKEQNKFLKAAGYSVSDEPDLPPPIADSIRSEIRNDWSVIEERTRGFVGRKFAFEAIQNFLTNPQIPRGYFLIHGQPGIGKTTLAAQLVKTEKYVHHFNNRARNVRTTGQFLRNICAQLILEYRLGHTILPERAGQDGDFFLEVLTSISRQLAPGKQTVIVIDALDEVDDTKVAGTNILYLPEIELLPRGIYIIATVRSNTSVRLSTKYTLYIDNHSDDNKADIREFIEQKLVLKGLKEYIQAQGITDKYFVDFLFEKSQGNFMYLRHVLLDINDGKYSDQNITELPEGLIDYYEKHWSLMRDADKKEWHEYKLPILIELVAAGEPITIDMLQKITRIRERTRIMTALGKEGWEQFLDISPDKRYSLYHASFRDFLATKDELEEGVSIRRGKLQIADAFIPDDLWG